MALGGGPRCTRGRPCHEVTAEPFDPGMVTPTASHASTFHRLSFSNSPRACAWGLNCRSHVTLGSLAWPERGTGSLHVSCPHRMRWLETNVQLAGVSPASGGNSCSVGETAAVA